MHESSIRDALEGTFLLLPTYFKHSLDGLNSRIQEENMNRKNFRTPVSNSLSPLQLQNESEEIGH